MGQALREHWPDYLLEAAGLMIFMIGAGLFTTLFLHPRSPVSQAIPSPMLQHAGLGACMGLVTFAIVSAIGERTGAHINPAVTLAFWWRRRITGWDATFYTLFQFGGAVLAPVILLAVIGEPFAHGKIAFATTRPSAGVSAAFAAEFAMSFVLMLTVLAALGSRRWEGRAPALLAVLIALYITVAGPVSGMSMNPARSFGSALTAGEWEGLWIYFAAPTSAMLISVKAYHLLTRRGVIRSDQPGPDHPVPGPVRERRKEALAHG